MRADLKALLQTKEKPVTHEILPIVVTFNKTLPNIKNVIDKHGYILFINEKLKKAFDKKLFIASRINKNLHQIIGGNHILRSKVVHKNSENHKQSGKCSPCVSRLNSLISKEVKPNKHIEKLQNKSSL